MRTVSADGLEPARWSVAGNFYSKNRNEGVRNEAWSEIINYVPRCDELIHGRKLKIDLGTASIPNASFPSLLSLSRSFSLHD